MKPWIGISLALLLTPGASAAGSFWQSLPPDEAPSFETLPAEPIAFRPLRVDFEALRSALASAPLQAALADRYPDRPSAAAAIRLSLPAPDGTEVEFEVYDSPVMADALARRYPDIQTYQAVSIANPATTARWSVTPDGFQAMVLDADRGNWLIDPLHSDDASTYGAYFELDYHREVDDSCASGHDHGPSVDSQTRGGLVNAGTLRTYRTAVAATGEYTQYHGGSVAEGLSAIVTAMNRVNGIYQRDAGIRMELVANNDLIVYTDPVTDPYTNGSTGDLVNENRTNLANVLGNENFDLGHVLGTGAGGLAFIASVCSNLAKAGGTSGLTDPVGDSFHVRILAHQLGHQWSARHTFNGVGGACAFGPNELTAFEPGSGSTIMALPGLCASDNVQATTDDYFHSASVDQILEFSTIGSGSNCGSTASTGNQAPLVDAGSNVVIPANTPFELCGQVTDPDGDTLSHSWEQFDLGPFAPLDNPTDSGPLFRSFPPDASPCRLFPNRADLLGGTPTPAEQLPDAGRTMTFRLTVRDQAVPAGGVASDERDVIVFDTGAPFAVTAPMGGEVWAAGQPQTVTWDVAGTDQAPISCPAVDIRLSIDGGLSFQEDLLLDAPNSGSATVTSFQNTDTARVEVRCSDGAFLAISPGDFEVIDPQLFEDRFEQ